MENRFVSELALVLNNVLMNEKAVVGSGANPDGCAKEQPPKKPGATDMILLNEWS